MTLPLGRTLAPLGRRHGSGVVTPDSLAGLKFWLKSDAGLYQDSAGTVPVTTNGQPVGRWSDQSGNGNHFVQGTSGLRPLYGVNIFGTRPAVKGDGTDDLLECAGLGTGWGSSLATLFVVFNPSGDTHYGLGLFEPAATDAYWRFSIDGNGYFGAFRLTRIEAQPTGQPSTGAHMMTVRSGASAYQLRRDGAAVYTGTPAWASGTDHRLFVQNPAASGYFSGYLAEVIAYNVELAAADIDSIETYLNERYSIF